MDQLLFLAAVITIASALFSVFLLWDYLRRVRHERRVVLAPTSTVQRAIGEPELATQYGQRVGLSGGGEAKLALPDRANEAEEPVWGDGAGAQESEVVFEHSLQANRSLKPRPAPAVEIQPEGESASLPSILSAEQAINQIVAALAAAEPESQTGLVDQLEGMRRLVTNMAADLVAAQTEVERQQLEIHRLRLRSARFEEQLAAAKAELAAAEARLSRQEDEIHFYDNLFARLKSARQPVERGAAAELAA